MMRFFHTDDTSFLATLRLACEHTVTERPERIIINVARYAHHLRQTFQGCVRPMTDKILYRREGCFPVIDLLNHPDRYVMYRPDIDPFDDQVKDLPPMKSVFVTDDILDLRTRRVIPYRALQQLTSQPNHPVQEYQLIVQYVENYLHQRLPLQYVRDNRWHWTDRAVMAYLKPDTYQAEDVEYQKERLNEFHEEIQFYLSDLFKRLDEAIVKHTSWMVYQVSGTISDLRIESRGDYRVFAWMLNNEKTH
jgi:hypothetical protein